eukprot:931303-Alexandrium_andersonii.AAC.1
MPGGEVLDLTATQGMDVDPPMDNLRRSPYGEQLHNLTEMELTWVKEERQVREWALANPDRWQTMPAGTGDDNEAFERYVYFQT